MDRDAARPRFAEPPIINDADRRLERIADGFSPSDPRASRRLGMLQGLAIRAVVRRYLNDTPPANFRVNVNPLITWIWVGGGIAVLGALVAVWPGLGARPRPSGAFAARLPRELSRVSRSGRESRPRAQVGSEARPSPAVARRASARSASSPSWRSIRASFAAMIAT